MPIFNYFIFNLIMEITMKNLKIAALGLVLTTATGQAFAGDILFNENWAFNYQGTGIAGALNPIDEMTYFGTSYTESTGVSAGDTFKDVGYFGTTGYQNDFSNIPAATSGLGIDYSLSATFLDWTGTYGATAAGNTAFSFDQGGTLNMFAYTMSLMIGTAGLPHVIMRFFTVPSVQAARQSAGYALVFIGLLYTVAPAVGAMARLNLMNTIEPAAGQNLEYAERPQWFKDWEKTGLLKYEDKNGDGKIQYTADKTTNEMVKVDRDIMVLANPAIANLPNWVIALVAAGGLAAALSTAAGLLLAISSSISHDLMKGVLTPDLSEKNELLAGRIVMTIAIIVSGYLGLNPPGFAAGTVALAFGLAASSIFPALMMGIFSRKMSGTAAIAGMCSGIGITMLYVFQHKGIMFIPGTSFLGGMEPNWFMGISPNAFGAVGALVNFGVAFAVLKVTGPAPAHIQDMVDHMRLPGKASAAHAH